jgi:hypothetical protein
MLYTIQYNGVFSLTIILILSSHAHLNQLYSTLLASLERDNSAKRQSHHEGHAHELRGMQTE